MAWPWPGAWPIAAGGTGTVLGAEAFTLSLMVLLAFSVWTAW